MVVTVLAVTFLGIAAEWSGEDILSFGLALAALIIALGVFGWRCTEAGRTIERGRGRRSNNTPRRPLADSTQRRRADRSSHLAGAVSEKVIAGWHDVQERPEAILELRRILHSGAGTDPQLSPGRRGAA